MDIEFTKRSKNNVCDAIEGKKSYKKLTSAEWHQFVQNYNYDDGIEPFLWLVEQPTCDKGTALCLYWYLSPGFYYKNDINEDDVNYNNYKLIKEIEKKFLDGFYNDEQFSFDPSAEFITNETGTSCIPKEMIQKTKGVQFERIDVEFAFLRFPVEKEQNAIAKKINNSIKIIKQVNPQFLDENPNNTIKTIMETVQYFKTHNIGKLKIKDLSFLWLDCVHRKYNWDWVMWDWET